MAQRLIASLEGRPDPKRSA